MLYKGSIGVFWVSKKRCWDGFGGRSVVRVYLSAGFGLFSGLLVFEVLCYALNPKPCRFRALGVWLWGFRAWFQAPLFCADFEGLTGLGFGGFGV